MAGKINNILKSILVPFLLVFITIFLTHVGMQTQLMDREMDELISRNMVNQMQIIRNYFVAEEVEGPLERLRWIVSSILPDLLRNPQEIQKVFSSRLGVLKSDHYLDHVALYNVHGELIAQQVLSPGNDPVNLAEFEDLIVHRRVASKVYGIDKTAQGLVLKIISPIHSLREGVVGYMSAIRYLDSRFFERIHRHTGQQVLIFRDDQAIFSTISGKEEGTFFMPEKIRERCLQTEPAVVPESTERIYIFDTEYHAISLPFQNLQGEMVGAIMLVSGLEGKKHSLKKIVLALLWATLIGVVLLLFFGFLISKGITKPINTLILATRRVSSGDFNATVEVQSHQELITLSDAFNTMTENLKRTLISKDYFHGIINTIHDLLIIFSTDHVIEFVNQATVKVLGYTREELIGASFELFFKGDYPLKGMDHEAITRKGVDEDCSCVMLTKGGESMPVCFSWAVTWDEKNHRNQIVGVARDIRERAKAERKIKEERDKLDTLINATNDLIAIRNEKGEFTFVSHAVEKILGYSPEEFKNLPFEKMLSSNPLNQNFVESPRLLVTGKKAEPYWTEFVTKDGNLIFLEINETLFPEVNGEGVQIMGIGRDISERKRLEDQLLDYQEKRMKKLKKKYRFGDIIGKTKKMQEIYELINIVSQNNSTVFLKGESGTGKEMIAQAIHYHSPRCNFPFVEVTCSVLSEHLLESELFGHVKGAFTGAIKDRPGRFEQARGGTIFLDEIGDISLNAQIKLLRVLQEREIVRVGGEERIKVDVRIIAATNKNLEKAVAEGTFREDLYYRLNVVPIFVPALRERKEDIPLLVEHFMGKIQAKIGKKINSISQRAMNVLVEYHWPGNIRQLENAIEYAMIRCRGTEIRARDFSAEIRNLTMEETSVQDLVATTEKTAIVDILRSCHWDMTRASQKLNVGRTTLWRKMKKYDIKKV